MNLSRLRQDDWEQFSEEYPDAHAWLVEKLIYGEYELLQREAATKALTPAKRERMQELKVITWLLSRRKKEEKSTKPVGGSKP